MDAAKQLLAEAGYPDGIDLVLHYTGYRQPAELSSGIEGSVGRSRDQCRGNR